MKLLNYIFGWLFFVSGMLIVSYKILLFLGLVRPALTAIDEVGAMLTILVGAVMIGIAAVLDRLDAMKEGEVSTKPDMAPLADRREPRLLSASDY